MHTHDVTATAHAATASVTLDIGGGRGALVIYPAERYRGQEIEISPVAERRRVHTGVHERYAHSGPVLTAIFGSLAAGDYDVWADPVTRATQVSVIAGEVRELELR